MKTTFQIIAAIVAGIVVAGALMLVFPPKARAEEEGGAVQLLFEPCRLTHMVTNLPRRATWTEGGKVYEGCWGPPHSQVPGVITTYWEDKTVVPILTDRMRRNSGPPKVGI